MPIAELTNPAEVLGLTILLTLKMENLTLIVLVHED
jgi:hypothetical protein